METIAIKAITLLLMILFACGFLLSLSILVNNLRRDIPKKREDGFEPQNEAEEECLKPEEGMDTTPNPWLVRQRQISLKNVIEIKNLHRIRQKTFEAMEKCISKRMLRQHAVDIEEIEYELQDLWGFPRDKRFHRWFEVPRCTCPKIDNGDNIGTDERIIAEDCPIHWTKKS